MCKKSLLMMLLFALFAPWAANAQSELTVYEGTVTNDVIPAYVFYFDDFTRSQFVIPADDLAEMSGGTITALKFYTNSSNIPYTAVSSANVYLMEVDYTTMTGLESTASSPLAYQGYFDFVSEGDGGSLTIELSTPYTYGGGNLLVAVENPEDNGWKHMYFLGTTVTGASWGGSNGNSLEGVTGSQRNFIPQTTFTYTPGETDCEMPTAIEVRNITHESAVVAWEGDGNAWNLRYKASTDEDYTMVNGLTETSYTLPNLAGNTTYSVGVQTVCTGSTSFFKSTSFTTMNPCATPTDLQITGITDASATLSWTAGYYTQDSWIVKYKKSTVSSWNDATTENVTAPNITLDGLDENTTYNVRIYACEDGGYLSGNFTTKYACAAPTNLVASNITGTSATLSWTPGYQETAWIVKYKTAADSEYTNELAVSGTPTVDLTGLQSGTTYNVRVYNCTGESDPYLSGNFTTAFTFPYSQDFSASGIPAGWTQWSGLLADVMAGTALTSSTYGWSNGTYNGVLDGNNIYSNIYGSSCNKWIVTPAIPMPAGARLTFDVAYTAYSGTAAAPATGGTDDKFVVLASTDNMATWTILRQWDNAGSEYVLDELTPTTLSLNFDMANYAGTNLQIAFYAESTVYNVDNDIHVDNVVFELVPSCEKPLNVAIDYQGGTTATVSFNSDATAWNLDVNGTVTAITTNPYTIQGLELATTYEVKVQAVCGAGNLSEWSNPVSFSTDLCMPENQCELTFVLTDSYGDGWNGCAIQVVDVATGIVVATMANQNLDGQTQIAETQTVTLAVCDGREIQFVWVMGSYPGEASWVITDVNGEEITSGTGTTSMATGDVLATYTVNCTVTNCKRPTDLATTAVLGHSVTLSWTENGEATAWVVAFSVDGVEFREVDATTNPFVLSDLDPETPYYVKVRPECEPGIEKWSDVITFTTDVACPAPTVTVEAEATSATVTMTSEAEAYNLRYRTPRGFNYGFEQAEAWTYDNFPPCTTYDGDGVQCWGVDGSTFTNFPFTGSTFAFGSQDGNLSSHSGDVFGLMVCPIYVDNQPVPADDWFILPELTIADGDVFQFWGREITTQYGDEIINVGIYGDTEGTFAEVIAENVAINSTTYTLYSYDLSAYAGQTIRLAINYVSEDVFGFMFDDIFVGNPEDDTWDYTLTNVTSPYEIPDLEAETEYELQVQAVCGEDGTSVWTSTITFTTLPLCLVPTNLAVSDITTESALVTWESEASLFDIDVNGEVTEDVTSPYPLYNLDPNTSYSIKVRAKCDATTISAWTSTYTFSTPCTAFDLPYEYGFDDVATSNNPEVTCWLYGSFNTVNSVGFVWRDQEAGDVALSFSSFTTADDYTQVLVSPELNTDEEIKVSFEYKVSSSYSEGESIMIGYSATNTLSDFEWTDEYTFEYTGEWKSFSTRVPAGTKYVAVLYTSVYQYYLYVDNFKFEEVLPTTQTIELVEGWNWVSIGIAVEDPVEMLDMLKASLGENALEIQSYDYTTEFDGEEWFGDLDEEGVYNEQMYLINAANDCTIELTGMPAVADEYEITINPGWNWIGFPSAVAIDVADALSDFYAAEGDEIQDVDFTTEFDGEDWFGDLETFEPGRGLLYNNTTDETKTLIFGTGAKKAARHASHSFGTPKHNARFNAIITPINGNEKKTDRAVSDVKTKSTDGNRTK